MARRRTYSVAFKRQVVQEYLAGESLHGLAKRHDLARNLIRIWVAKYEAGALTTTPRPRSPATVRGEDRGARAHGGPAGPGARVPKGGVGKRSAIEKRAYVRHHRPCGLSVTQGCRLMGLPRSTFYDGPMAQVDEAEIVARMRAICDEFEAYGYRRVGATLRQQGVVVNGKKIRRLMRAHDLQPRRRRRFVATTDSDHDRPSSRIAPRAWWSTLEPALGRRHHLHRNRGRLRLSRRHPRCLVAPGGRLCNQPLGRRATDAGGTQGRPPYP